MSATPIELLFAAHDLPSLGPLRRSAPCKPEEIETELAPFLGKRQPPGNRGQCLHALVLLWNDHFDLAHGIVQDLTGPDAAFVHGIIHRREPDYANARYWFQRVGEHPVLERLAEAAAPILAGHPALPYRLIREGRWNTFAFIDAVSAACERGDSAPETALLRELQRQEAMTLARHLAES
jgi:hypothetical protein